ncbi:hypothetical protein YYG_03022 [Plasmodium vinckei petteri]|uniref:BTB domain-containing protein n=1 Tax=Plasmodium vinckei petteri TaxID=138298 RepID=W7ASQ9_PLAVN|nr:hypothetical protein YYG_03022 [Plasmodium vinckei petteri]CAD2098929.1 conserved Plasmodium protein, unknown function [Plasmodium vinckei petteri]
MPCCSKKKKDITTQRKDYLNYKEKYDNEVVAICDNQASIINIIKKGNECNSEFNNKKGSTIKKEVVKKSNLLNYYEKSVLKGYSKIKSCEDVEKKLNDLKLKNEIKKEVSKEKDMHGDQNDDTKEKYKLEEFSKLNPENKSKVLNEIEKQINEHKKHEISNVHDELAFLSIYKLTHKKIYAILDQERKHVDYYNCNEVLEMVLNNKLHKHSLIKTKTEDQYAYLENKIKEIQFLKNFELQYYLKIKNKRFSMKSEYEKEYSKNDAMFLELSESLLAEKIKSLKNFVISPYDKNVVEIILIPNKKNSENFGGYHRIFSNLFITKYISSYFYHIIEKKIEKHNLMKKTNNIHIRMKLKTNYPQAIKNIFKYIYDKHFRLQDLDFKLLITIYIECKKFKIVGIIDDVINTIREKTNFENILKILEISPIFKETEMIRDFSRILSDSWYLIFSENYHYLLDVETFSHFISFDNIMINEMRIFIEVIKFIIKNNCNLEEQEIIFKNVRFSLLSHENLYNMQKYIKNSFDDIIHNKYDGTNFICMRYEHEKIKNKYGDNDSEIKFDGLKSQKEVNEKKDNDVGIISDEKNDSFNASLYEEVKNLNEFYKIINMEAFEPPFIEKKNVNISLKNVTKCINNIYSILFDNIFKKLLNKDEVKERHKPWNENKHFQCVNNLASENYSFQLVKKKSKVDKYSFTYGDERLINECRYCFKIIKSKNSNISIGAILKVGELNMSNHTNFKIPKILTEGHKELAIYFDFFVNDFYVCNINENDNSKLLNKTKLNIHAHENKLTENDIINYNISIINQILNIDIIILPKNITFKYSFPILQPTTYLGEIIKMPFINIKPFFIFKDSLDSILMPSVKI